MCSLTSTVCRAANPALSFTRSSPDLHNKVTTGRCRKRNSFLLYVKSMRGVNREELDLRHFLPPATSSRQLGLYWSSGRRLPTSTWRKQHQHQHLFSWFAVHSKQSLVVTLEGLFLTFICALQNLCHTDSQAVSSNSRIAHSAAHRAANSLNI